MMPIDEPHAADVQRILNCVQQRAGLSFRPTQRRQASLSVSRVMQRRGDTALADYARRVEQDLDAFDELIVELVVGETYFFRFPEQFEFVRETLGSEFHQRRHHAGPIRVWSAACATGEESYSLAITFHELGLLKQTQILATDISRTSLERAQRGLYREWSFRGNGAARAKRYAARQGTHYQLDAAIRQSVHFAYLNLALDVYPSHVTGTRNIDLIFCRNVLMYFERAAIQRVAERLYDSLAPGGWLVTAASDPPLDDFASFETVEARGGVYYRRPHDARRLPAPVLDAVTPLPHSRDAEPQVPHGDWPEPMTTVDVSIHRQEPSLPLLTHDAVLDHARQALLAGDYAKAIELTEPLRDDVAASVLLVKALANQDAGEAERICQQLAQRHPLAAELRYLHGVLLMEQRRDDQAWEAIKRVLYLDGSLAIAHFMLGTLARRRGEILAAQRAFRNVVEQCRVQDEMAAVRFAEEETYGSLCHAAESQIEALKAPTERQR